MGSKYKVFDTPKRHIRNDVIWRIERNNRCRGLGCRLSEEWTSRVTWCAFSHIGGEGQKGVIVSLLNFA